MEPNASAALFTATFWMYIAAGANYVYLLQSKKDKLARYATILAATGFMIHTSALIARWVEAGIVEVAAFEQAMPGVPLVGFERFLVFIQHPPFSNLYESLVFFAWGAMLVYLFLQRRYKIYAFGIFAVLLVITTLGLASLSPGQEIKPLVPALQSKWILIHVINASIAYPAFLLAAFASFLYLVKVGVSVERMGIGIATVIGGVAFAMGGGTKFFMAPVRLTLTFPFEGRLENLMYSVHAAKGGEVVSEQFVLKMGVPGINHGLLLAFVGAAIAVAGFGLREKLAQREALERAGRIGMYGMTAGIAFAIAAFFYNIATMKGLSFTSDEARALVETDLLARFGVPATVMQFQLAAWNGIEVSLRSNPFMLTTLVLCLAAALLYLTVLLRREQIAAALPQAELLDRLSNRAILVGYPAVTLLLITGAIWAHYSWGRYWGWDPKETWALITWMLYTFYFHSRMTHGWAGKKSAAIAVVGFVVVIFTYLGVNLGLTGDGLHSYGSG